MLAALAGWLALAVAVGGEEMPDFTRDVRPILAEHCFACHGPDAGQRQAGLRLDRRDAAIVQLASGKVAISPGKAQQSELVLRVESADSDSVMPPPETKKSLTVRQKELLKRWIDSGAPYAEHWAYQTPQRPVLPAVANRQWARGPIDLFVQAKLADADISPAP